MILGEKENERACKEFIFSKIKRFRDFKLLQIRCRLNNGIQIIIFKKNKL